MSEIPEAAANSNKPQYTREALAAAATAFLDAKADEWMADAGVQQMFNAIGSVFEKWAPQEIMDRFRQKLGEIGHQCYVEGAFRAWSEISAERAAPQSPPAATSEPECTDCGGTGITFQTERRCACQVDPDRAAMKAPNMTEIPEAAVEAVKAAMLTRQMRSTLAAAGLEWEPGQDAFVHRYALIALEAAAKLAPALKPYTGPARDGIEAQRGLNDTWPGDPYP